MIYMFTNKEINIGEVVENEVENYLASKKDLIEDTWGLSDDDVFLANDVLEDNYLYTENDDKIVEDINIRNFYYNATDSFKMPSGIATNSNGNVYVDSHVDIDVYDEFYDSIYILESVNDVLIVSRKVSDYEHILLFLDCLKKSKSNFKIEDDMRVEINRLIDSKSVIGSQRVDLDNKIVEVVINEDTSLRLSKKITREVS